MPWFRNSFPHTIAAFDLVLLTKPAAMHISQIDIGRIGLGAENPTADDYSAVGKDLFKAFESTGFAYITDHGVQPDLVTKCMKVSEKFFHLPKEEKDKYKKDDAIH